MATDLFKIVESTITMTRHSRYIVRRIYTPCCMAGSTLKGEPAPQYHCDACDKVYTSLAEFQPKESPDG